MTTLLVVAAVLAWVLTAGAGMLAHRRARLESERAQVWKAIAVDGMAREYERGQERRSREKLRVAK